MINTTCPIDGCDRTIRAAGLCDTHYRRMRKYGDPEFMHDLQCDRCGEKFQSKNSGRKYCSTNCQNSAREYKSRKTGPTCAGCGVRMYRGKGVLPQGQATCQKCRKSGLGPIPDKHGTVRYFNLGCRCEFCAAAKREANMAYKARVKAEHGVNPSTLYRRRYRERTGVRYRMAPSDWIDPKLRVEIYERDGWVCHLCDDPVDRVADFNDDLAPSLDHLKPRSKGGSDDPDNLATAHRLCNSRRRDDELEALEVV